MDPKLERASRGMYPQSHGRFRLGLNVGETFWDTNGILQGCPLSVLLLNALMSVLNAVLQRTSVAESFIDDLTILNDSPEVLQGGIANISEIMAASGKVVNSKKTKTFGPQDGAAEIYKDAPVPKTETVNILGVTWRFTNGSLNLQVDAKKVEEAIALANRIRDKWLPFHMRCRKPKSGYVQFLVWDRSP